MNKITRTVLFLLLFVFAITSCKRDNDDTTEIVNREIYNLMNDYYLWYDKLPANIDPSAYATPSALMDALRYKTFDQWSVVITKTEYYQYFEEGKMIGHGFLLGLDENDNVRVAFVYRSNQAFDQGVKRGWIVSRVNGNSVNPSNVFNLLGESEIGIRNRITFIDEDGVVQELTLTKEEIEITPVIHYEVLNQNDTMIGYMVFQDFIDAANEELDEAFTLFASEGIDEMIVDLRYNGGGSVDVAEYLAGWLIGKNFGNQPFVNFRHNDKYAGEMDTTINVPAKANGLDLSRIFFIGTSSTASASELIINGVKPFVGSVLAGSATHGKPVGMYAIPFINYDYVVLPVMFKYTNADDEGDFYEGLPVTLPAEDDLTKDFGDPEEGSLKTILDYIGTGIVPEKSTKSTAGRKNLIESDKPVNQFLKAY